MLCEFSGLWTFDRLLRLLHGVENPLDVREDGRRVEGPVHGPHDPFLPVVLCHGNSLELKGSGLNNEKPKIQYVYVDVHS